MAGDITRCDIGPERYVIVNQFMRCMKRNARWISTQEYKTLRGQALAGDLEGAKKGLARLLAERMQA